MINNLFPIAKSGFKYLIPTAIVFVVLEIFDFDFLAFLSLLLFFGFAYTYRNPERAVPFFEASSVVAPVDGVISGIEELKDSEYAYKIEITRSCLNVGVLRTPMDGSVESLKIVRGSRLSSKLALSKDINEYAEIVFCDPSSNKLKIVHTLNQSFAPIEIDIIKQQTLRQATRYGMLVNATTTIFIPQNFRLNVQVANELKASETLLGYFS